MPRTPLVWGASLLLALLVASAAFGPGGALAIRRQRGERAALEDEIFRRMHDNDELRTRLQSVRHSDRELERLARQELGLVRDGEIVYRFAPGKAVAKR